MPGRKSLISLLTGFLLAASLALPARIQAEVLTTDTVWEGKIELTDDVLIPPGVILTVKPGATITISPSESTKIDPEYLSHQNEILVRGALKIQGSTTAPITFAADSSKKPEHDEDARWAGILVDGGVVEAQSATINGAETGVYVLSGTAALTSVTIEENHYGVIADGGQATITLTKSTVQKNDYGVSNYNSGTINESNVTIANNRKKDHLVSQSTKAQIPPLSLGLAGTALTHAYTDETLLGTTLWRGRIRIDGQVRLPPEGRLVIMPGTIIEFSKHDTNGDGIGENGILIQGALTAKGTKEQPIIFRSAEKTPQIGDWDSINILGSDQQRNLIEFCQVEDAYRGFHFHFSAVAVTNSVLRHNYRGIQFQESVVELRDNQLYNNKSGLQCRDSDVTLTRNRLFDNIIGANLYRLNLQARDNTFANNRWDGLRIREGAATVEQNLMTGNRFGLQVADAVFGRFSRNLMAANIENGLALRNTDNIETNANAIIGNGVNGLIIRESRGAVTGNYIADNGERGIGIQSFIGQINANTIMDNGLYGIGLEGKDDIAAAGNWWGDSDLSKEIFDRHDDQTLGLVTFEPKAAAPLAFAWPTAAIPVSLKLGSDITVNSTLVVDQGATLTIKPGTNVRFAAEAGMNILGRIEALGSNERRISFAPLLDKGQASWGEIKMEQATGSRFTNCDFSKATWALHSHFVNLKVNRCLFTDNEGGIRINSGPVEISQSLFTGNRIGFRSFRGIASLHDNEFTGNETAIFVREKGSGTKINHNNIMDNGMYAIRLGDFNDEDVDARDNWWGGKPVVDQVFDGHREAYIGKVLFEPELQAPITLDWQPRKGGNTP